MPYILGFSTVENNSLDSGFNCSYFSACLYFFLFNQNIISVKQFRSVSGPSGLICVQNCLQKDKKNLIGIQNVKHSLDRDHAGHYVGLDLGLNFLLKKKTVFDKFTKIYGKCSKKLNTLKF